MSALPIRRQARTILTLVVAALLALATAPGSAVATATQPVSRPPASLRLAKQATSFDRTAKAAATLAASEIRWELRNANTAGRPDVITTFGGVTSVAVVTGDWDGNGSDTPGVVYQRSGELEWQLRDATMPGRPDHVFRYGGLDAGGLVAGDWDGNRSWTPGIAY
jgi:hypothetical protein